MIIFRVSSDFRVFFIQKVLFMFSTSFLSALLEFIYVDCSHPCFKYVIIEDLLSVSQDDMWHRQQVKKSHRMREDHAARRIQRGWREHQQYEQDSNDVS